MTLELPIVAVAQMNREAEGLKAPYLHMGHLAECSGIEQDASFIGLLGEREFSGEDGEIDRDHKSVRSLSLNVVANRFGPSAELIHLVFLANQYRFERAAGSEQ